MTTWPKNEGVHVNRCPHLPPPESMPAVPAQPTVSGGPGAPEHPRSQLASCGVCGREITRCTPPPRAVMHLVGIHNPRISLVGLQIASIREMHAFGDDYPGGDSGLSIASQ